MPIVKHPKKAQPLWKEWDYKAQKKGIRHTVYSVNGDKYTGEWFDNKKSGKGTYMWKTGGAIYDGDWKLDKRNGFGTYSVPTEDRGYIKEYSGGWKNDKKHGFGRQYYPNGEYYEGEWYAGKRSGWGTMCMTDGSVYEGEWFDDERSGNGTLKSQSENRYVGEWKNGKKNGPGAYYYFDKGQKYEGIWVDDVAKCGEMTDFDRDSAPQATRYPLPEIQLENVYEVLEEARIQFAPDLNLCSIQTTEPPRAEK